MATPTKSRKVMLKTTSPVPLLPKQSIRESEGIDLHLTFAACPDCDEVFTGTHTNDAWDKVAVHRLAKCKTGLRAARRGR